ncbi:cupin domain-containing protein [Micromonospora sp. NPDC049051]|uniref:cupin domain-containing protein n=1 Tax=unclassified Micromonospora TaxID=2617518 RepID=UPI00371495C6
MQKVRLRRLPLTSPPIPAGGGRIESPAGELAQIVNGGTYRFLAYLEFRPDARPRGNHYHVHKTETLYVISGRLRAVFRDLDSDERTELTIGAGDLVTVQPRCAHAYHAQEHAQAVELADTPYDPTDTHPWDVADIG